MKTQAIGKCSMVRERCVIVLAACAMLLIAPRMVAQTTINLVGNATATDSTILLTPPERQQAGAAWLPDRRSLRNPFHFEFTFKITQKDTDGEVDPSGKSGGDGIAFVFQDQNPGAIGGVGYGLGYGKVPQQSSGILKSAAIEIDTWDDTGELFAPDFADLGSSHVAFHSNGAGWNSSDIYSMLAWGGLPDVDDGQEHHVMIDYQPGLLTVRLDAIGAVLQWRGRLDTLLHSDSAWFGVTGSTGGAYQRQELTSGHWGPDTVRLPGDTVRHTDTLILVKKEIDSVPYPVLIPYPIYVPYPVYVDRWHDRWHYDTLPAPPPVHDTLPTVHDTLIRWRDTCCWANQIPDSVCGASDRIIVRRQYELRILSIVPNPATSKATIQYSVPGDGKTLITIYNARGDVVLEQEDHWGEGVRWWTFGVDRLPAGRYEVELKSGTGRELAELQVIH